jgi:hypothetical protein
VPAQKIRKSQQNVEFGDKINKCMVQTMTSLHHLYSLASDYERFAEIIEGVFKKSEVSEEVWAEFLIMRSAIAKQCFNRRLILPTTAQRLV